MGPSAPFLSVGTLWDTNTFTYSLIHANILSLPNPLVPKHNYEVKLCATFGGLSFVHMNYNQAVKVKVTSMVEVTQYVQ